jgi:two-component system, response regulator YesN
MKSYVIRVLIAEDESLQLANITRMVLQVSDKFEVVAQAQTGIQALEMAEEYLPDVVITDIQMPMMGGIELVEALRDRLPGTQFIIISGYSEFEYAQRAISLGVAAYLLKPVDPKELADTLSSVYSTLQLQYRTYEDSFTTVIATESPRHIAEALKEYLCAHFNENINLNLIASNLGYNPSHLTKLFHRYYGVSPIRFLTSQRMTKARYYIKYRPEFTIRQISEMTGYEDQGYFSRVFKKENGASPLEYRETTE